MFATEKYPVQTVTSIPLRNRKKTPNFNIVSILIQNFNLSVAPYRNVEAEAQKLVTNKYWK